MKKLLYSIAALAAVTAMHSQEQTTVSEGFNKGDTFITGSVGVISQKQGDAKTTGFNIGPSAGYFISEKIALGARLSYAQQHSDDPAFPHDLKQNAFTGGLFGRYYFTPQNKFSIYGQLGADYNNYKRENYGDTEETSKGFGISAGPGFNYFITPHLALQSFIGALTYAKGTNEIGGNSTDSSSLSLNLDISNIYFGLTYKF